MLPDPLPHGFALGPYRIEGELKRGTWGRFYRALDTRLNSMVAVNVLDPDRRTPEGNFRFIAAVRRLAKDGDRRLLDLGAVEGAYYASVTYESDTASLLDVGAGRDGTPSHGVGSNPGAWLRSLRRCWSRITTRS